MKGEAVSISFFLSAFLVAYHFLLARCAREIRNSVKLTRAL